MGPLASRLAPLAPTVAFGQPTTPVWVNELLGDSPHAVVSPRGGCFDLLVTQAERFSFVAVSVPGIESMDAPSFQYFVKSAYRAIFEQLSHDQSFPVRCWSFIPRIHYDYGNGLDRYKVFNAGRFAAYVDRLGAPDAFGRSLPTASAVGSSGDDLMLRCLASPWPGRPVENPRQIPAYHYSSRFGPQPPCFSRATLLPQGDDRPQLLLVGGTASIRGEDSMHVGEVVPQALETFCNLASVVRAACLGDSSRREDLDEPAVTHWLQQFRELRVYTRETEHRLRIVEMIRQRFRALRRMEVIQAELCRPELLVEIEGVAEVPLPLNADRVLA